MNKYFTIITDNYKRILSIVISCFSFGFGSIYAQVPEFYGTSLRVLKVEPDKSTGLNNIYICYDVKGVEIRYKSKNPDNVKWYKYSNLGAAFEEEIHTISTDSEYSVLMNPEGDMGYIIEDSDSRYYFWLVNYVDKRLDIKSVEFSSVQDCDYTVLDVTGSFTPIQYFTINGQQKLLSRDIEVIYDSQVWNNQTKEFQHTEIIKNFENLTSELRLTPPSYCSTYFTIKGDRFLKEWNWEQIVESKVAEPVAVAVYAVATQQKNTEEVKSNQIKSDSDGLGGSAPADITFTAYTSQGVVHDEWQLSKNNDFENVEYRFSVKELDYTFMEEGTYYLRYIGSNNDGSCEATSEVFTVSIGTSELLCPNAFTPDDDGVNDEWKVSYRSILDFKCWIFDRAGHQLAVLTDPEQGWDGKYKGKTVRSGAYYYIIQAKGADGKEYKLNGDINIIRHKKITENSVE